MCAPGYGSCLVNHSGTGLHLGEVRQPAELTSVGEVACRCAPSASTRAVTTNLCPVSSGADAGVGWSMAMPCSLGAAARQVPAL
jgi:hypothetical protein